MTSSVLIEFTLDELRALVPQSTALLEGPLGVYPGAAKEARAQLTAAFKILRARYTAGGWKFLPLPPNLAPFACELIVNAMAPGRVEAVEAPRRGRPRKSTPAARRSTPRRRVGRPRGEQPAASAAAAAAPADAPPEMVQ